MEKGEDIEKEIEAYLRTQADARVSKIGKKNTKEDKILMEQ